MRGSAIFFPRQWHFSPSEHTSRGVAVLGIRQSSYSCAAPEDALYSNLTMSAFVSPARFGPIVCGWGEKRALLVCPLLSFSRGEPGGLRSDWHCGDLHSLCPPVRLLSVEWPVCESTDSTTAKAHIHIHERSHWVVSERRQRDWINIKQPVFEHLQKLIKGTILIIVILNKCISCDINNNNCSWVDVFSTYFK